MTCIRCGYVACSCPRAIPTTEAIERVAATSGATDDTKRRTLLMFRAMAVVEGEAPDDALSVLVTALKFTAKNLNVSEEDVVAFVRECPPVLRRKGIPS